MTDDDLKELGESLAKTISVCSAYFYSWVSAWFPYFYYRRLVSWVFF